ncbi:hypothetical protein [Amnimonas aquatica]|uniref:Uncharacterized protein n=1 Tax=Amnimonas aquatica TaxID=2094561 RepID=A0A2P6ASM2_9GAMM|nr:hypothetical protein [Amnimonas aquatica]PQA43419.1 hypothetical protein C5O18_05245 [Amnimonas aquatica]
MSVYAMAWPAYLLFAILFSWLLLRMFPLPAAGLRRSLQILFLVAIFSPALMSENGDLYAAPVPAALLFELLAKSFSGVVKALLPVMLFGGVVLWLDALRQRGRGA